MVRLSFTEKYKDQQNGSHYYYNWDSELFNCCYGITHEKYCDYMGFSFANDGKKTTHFGIGIKNNRLFFYCNKKKLSEDELYEIIETSVNWFVKMSEHGYIKIYDDKEFGDDNL